MKILATVLFFLVSLSAHAQYFRVNASCNFSPVRGQCSVYNSGHRSMYCKIRTQGLHQNGVVTYAYNNTWVAPRGYAYTYVTNNNPYNPFRAVNGYATCRF